MQYINDGAELGALNLQLTLFYVVYKFFFT